MSINFLNIIQVLVGIALIGFILIQRGPGATAGSAFGGGGGGGASGTVFGAKGSGSFLTKSTAILATAFFIVTMLIAIDSRQLYADGDAGTEQDLGLMGNLETEAAPVMIPGDDVDNEAAVDQAVKEAVTPAVNNATEEVKEPAVEDAAEQNAASEVSEKPTEEQAKEDGDQ